MLKMIYAFILLALISSGCAPAIVGGGAAGAYKVGTEERTMGTMVDDSTIAFKVKNELISAPDVKARNVDVDVIDGIVTLTGMVDSDNEIKRAGEITLSVEGVKGVSNYLAVGDRSMGQVVEDKVIVGKINSSLLTEPGMRTFNIDVDVNNGVVTLTGITATAELKNRAIEIARNTKGVVKVIDNLKIGK